MDKEKAVTDYSKMSDFEINKAVAEHLYKDSPSLIVKRDVPSRPAVTVFCDIGNEEIVSIVCADYCNDPADAWPIIAGNGIGASASKREPFAWDTSGGMLQGIRHSDKNTLRAAMIVFLMMMKRG